jgi:hypothetical protein
MWLIYLCSKLRAVKLPSLKLKFEILKAYIKEHKIFTYTDYERAYKLFKNKYLEVRIYKYLDGLEF